MFELKYEGKIIINDIPIQWIPKIEIYYPDLPQFPIMYIHTYNDAQRVIACPISVNYKIINNYCNAEFTVLTNCEFDEDGKTERFITTELKERIGFSNKISLDNIIDCCNNNSQYKKLMEDLWQYIEKSYGSTIPFGKYYEEMYSIVRFVSSWNPKTGRQSEMRMLYNFMSQFGEETILPENYQHLEFYVIPNYQDCLNNNFSDFENFKTLYTTMKKVFDIEFNKDYTIKDITFKVMNKAWKQNKNDFIELVSKRLFEDNKINEDERYSLELLVDVFNRNSWRAAFFISSFMNIQNYDYSKWTKDFFNEFYINEHKLKGYSPKVIACFLQQGFSKEEIIPIDTWIETFYEFPLGIKNRSDFYKQFKKLGKMERVIWLASQSNKTNMKIFFDILWCQRYGTVKNGEIRGTNPLSCYCCKLNTSCVGLSKVLHDKVIIQNDIKEDDILRIEEDSSESISFVCSLEKNIPKKVYKKKDNNWILIDEFSGYRLTSKNKFSDDDVYKKILSIQEFIEHK